MNTQTTSWQEVFSDFLVVAVLILILFRIIRFLLPLLSKRKKKVQKFILQLPLIETIIWLLYFSFYLFRFAEILSLYALVVAGILFVLIFWISKYFLKDLIAGMFFRISGRFKEGEVISLDDQKGKIQRFGIQSLEIETQEGPIVFMPYSKLMDSVFIKSESEEQSPSYGFELELLPTKSKEEYAERITSFLIALPWSSFQKKPDVQIKEGENGSYRAAVSVFPLEKHYAERIEQHTKLEFEHKNALES